MPARTPLGPESKASHQQDGYMTATYSPRAENLSCNLRGGPYMSAEYQSKPIRKSVLIVSVYKTVVYWTVLSAVH